MLDKQIISEKSLRAVEELALFMKENVRRRELFQGPNHALAVQQIVTQLERGGQGLREVLEDGLVMESASALENFLLHLKSPLIPQHIQALALDENAGICTEVIAQDILGLLKQDLSDRHLRLLVIVLDLLYYLLKHSPSNELSGYNIPISMMPVFFNLQAHHMANWRRIASIFVELIKTAPSYLDFEVDQFDDNPPIVENFEHEDLLLHQRIEFYALFRYVVPRLENFDDTLKLRACKQHKFRSVFSYVNA